MTIREDRRYGSRKFIMAAFVEGAATIVMFFFAWKLQASSTELLPFLTWWASVSGVVLTLYGASSITDKKLNREKTE